MTLNEKLLLEALTIIAIKSLTPDELENLRDIFKSETGNDLDPLINNAFIHLIKENLTTIKG